MLDGLTITVALLVGAAIGFGIGGLFGMARGGTLVPALRAWDAGYARGYEDGHREADANWESCDCTTSAAAPPRGA